MRLIPKKTKLKTTVFMSLTLLDMVIIAVMLVMFFLIIASNIPYNWVLALVFAAVCVLMMIGDADTRFYNDVGTIAKFLVTPKLFTKEPTKKSRDVEALIPFYDILEDGIIDYNSYYGAVLSVSSIAFELLEENEQNNSISALAQALSGLSLTSTVQIVKIDRPINYDKTAQMLFEKIRAEESLPKRNEAKLAILRSRLAQIDALNNVTPQFRPFYYVVVYDDTKEDVIAQAQVLKNGIEQAGLDCERLNQLDTALFFKYSYSRNFDERKSFDGTAIDFVKPQKVKFQTSSVMIDNVYSFTYAISDFPLWVTNAWGADLFNIDNTKVVLTIKPIEKSKSIRRIDNAITEIASRTQRKMSEAVDGQTHVDTMTNLLQRLQNGNESLFDCTLTVTGFNYSEEPNSAFRKDVYRKIAQHGFKINILMGNQLQGFAASAISRYTPLKRFECSINSESLAAIYPFVFSSIIEPKGVVLGYDYYPVSLDIWKRNENYNNSNIIVLGKSGAGKSYFTSSLITNLYSDDVQMFIFDPENEYSVLCENVGGKFIDVGNAVEGRINPLQIYEILTDDGVAAAPESVYTAHLRFLEDFFRITLPGINADSLEELNNLVCKLYEKHNIFPETDVTHYEATKFPTFDDFVEIVEKELELEEVPMRRENLTRIKMYVEKFASGGRYSSLWNGPSTLNSDEPFVVFNFQSLFAAKNVVVSNAQMLLMLRFLEQKIINVRELNRNYNRNIHPMVIIDEGYNFIDPKYPVALDFMHSWFKRIRKYNGSMMFLTQNLSDVLGNEEIVAKTSAIINNSQYSFIFGLAPADINALTELYEKSGGINETERTSISTAQRGDCFAILSSRHRAIFHVATSDVIEAIFLERGSLKSMLRSSE